MFNKKNYFLGASVIFLLVAIGSWLSRSLGWYNTYWFTDVTLHILSGIGFGMIWIGCNSKHHSPLSLLFVSTVSFAVFGSVVWEFWEFAGWHLIPAHTQFYIPQLGDTLGDIFCGLLGGTISAASNRLF